RVLAHGLSQPRASRSHRPDDPVERRHQLRHGSGNHVPRSVRKGESQMFKMNRNKKVVEFRRKITEPSYSPNELSQYLQISVDWISQHSKEGAEPCLYYTKVGKVRRYLVSEVERFLDDCRCGGPDHKAPWERRVEAKKNAEQS